MSNRNKKEDMQVLRAYFKDELETDLTPHQEEKVRQVRQCYALLLDAWGQADIVVKLEKAFKISKTTAYRVLRDTESLFGTLRKANKEILRQVVLESAREALRIARKKKSPKDIIAANKLIADVGGLYVDDPDMPDFERLQPSIIVTVLPDGMEQQIQEMLGGGAIDFNKFLPKTIDIEHEDITGDTN